jgi:hypothetical protein
MMEGLSTFLNNRWFSPLFPFIYETFSVGVQLRVSKFCLLINILYARDKLRDCTIQYIIDWHHRLFFVGHTKTVSVTRVGC